jgi:hypothetical protein
MAYQLVMPEWKKTGGAGRGVEEESLWWLCSAPAKTKNLTLSKVQDAPPSTNQKEFISNCSCRHQSRTNYTKEKQEIKLDL